MTPTREIELGLLDGRKARAHAYTDGVLLCVCEQAFAPGQPFAASVCTQDGMHDGALELRGKTASSKLRDDGKFDVRVRLHSLRREQRSWLEQNLPRM